MPDLPDINTVPERLPITSADPKQPLESSTIRWSLLSLLSGVVVLVLPSLPGLLGLPPLPQEIVMGLYGLGITQLTAAVGSINGRIRAEQPIALPRR